MIIHLQRSKLFTVDPAIRFANEYGCSSDVWREVWKRKELLAYTNLELIEYLEIKLKQRLDFNSIARWIWRTKVYSRANPMIKKGVQTVVSDFFAEDEEKVIEELAKNLKASGSRTSRILI